MTTLFIFSFPVVVVIINILLIVYNSEYKKNLWIVNTILIILMIWMLSPIIMGYFNSDVNTRGVTGDSFGALTSLFTGLTIAGLIYTIKLQRDEIRETKLHERYARFTDEFFKFLELHRNIYDSLNADLANFEENIVKNNKSAVEDVKLFVSYYRNNLEMQHVIKNYGNYLRIFDVIINYIVKNKKKSKSRDKYFLIYFGLFHRNEKRMLIYHFSFTEQKPKHWNVFKKYLYLDFGIDHIEEKEFQDILDLK